MAYYIDLFSPETYQTFGKSNRDISGFRPRQRNTADKIKPGDKFLCYVTKISRWVGILEVTSKCFNDNTPIFIPEDDPFTVRFKVQTDVWLDLNKAVPIHEDLVWNTLSFTKSLSKHDKSWTNRVRGSLFKLDNDDGEFLERVLKEQTHNSINYELSEEDIKKIQGHSIRTPLNKQISVSIPEEEIEEQKLDIAEHRQSIQIQALLAEIGEKMGMKIWVPRSDRSRVLDIWKPQGGSLLESLPMNYDDTTLRTIEQIDVLWIRRTSIVRAFEVEHTTSIYSGILRMADLLALQPNLDIKAHIVAPAERREKVFQEITRPVFSLLEKGPLVESCTFLSYDSLIELHKQGHLEYMKDTVLDEYTEEAETM
ncbi:MAG: EVE domain-containing protein [Bacteroidota bacterium]